MSAPDSASGSDSARLNGMHAIVTGGASGIGLASASLLAARGAKVVVADRDFDRAQDAAANIENGIAEKLDVSQPQQIDALFAKYSDVQILVNSAGIAKRQPAIEHSIEDWSEVVAVNMTGTFLCSRAAAKHMLAAGRTGSIINIASIMGMSGGGLYPNISYQTTKGAVVNMTRALAVEWASHGIRVNAVAPTYVKTPFIEALFSQPELIEQIKALTPLNDFALPEDVAEAVLFLAAGTSRMITGHVLPVDGGFLAQ